MQGVALLRGSSCHAGVCSPAACSQSPTDRAIARRSAAASPASASSANGCPPLTRERNRGPLRTRVLELVGNRPRLPPLAGGRMARGTDIRPASRCSAVSTQSTGWTSIGPSNLRTHLQTGAHPNSLETSNLRDVAHFVHQGEHSDRRSDRIMVMNRHTLRRASASTLASLVATLGVAGMLGGFAASPWESSYNGVSLKGASLESNRVLVRDVPWERYETTQAKLSSTPSGERRPQGRMARSQEERVQGAPPATSGFG